MNDFSVTVSDITRPAVALDGGDRLAVVLNIGPAIGSVTATESPTSGLIAVQALGGHRVVIATGVGMCDYADQNNAAHFNRVVGVTTGAASAGAVALVQQMSVLTFSGWSWTPDADIYVGSNGLMTQTPPTTGAFVQAVGFALSPTSMWIEIHPPISL